MNKTIRSIFFILFIITAFIFLLYNNNRQSMDLDTLNISHIEAHMKELSSAKYAGRQTGSTGNQLGMDYIIQQFKNLDIEPAGTDGSYYQPFNALVPEIDQNPVFTINSSTGSPDKELIMYKDYNALTYLNGGGIDFHGKILLAGLNLLRIDAELIKDSVVIVEAGRLDSKWVNYVEDKGGKGILCCTDTQSFGLPKLFETNKSMNASNKINNSLFIGYLSRDAYNYMTSYLGTSIDGKQGSALGVIDDATIKVNMTFPIVETANIAGKIQGNSSNGQTLILSANIDNLGMGTDEAYFPGTLSETSGIASLIEIARVLASQDYTPYDTIIFLGLNGQSSNLAGSNYYINHPLTSLAETTHIHLGSLGESSHEPVNIYYNPLQSSMLKDQLQNYGEDLTLNLSSVPMLYGTIGQFSTQSVPSVIIESSTVINNYDDTIANYSQEKLSDSLVFVMNYIKHEIYRDNSIDFLTRNEWFVLLIILAAGLSNLIIATFYNSNPSSKFLSTSMEEVYFTAPVILLRRFFQSVFPYMIAIFMLSILANINPNTNVEILSDRLTSNFSFYLTIKESILYLRSMFNPATHNAQNVGNIFEVIYSAGSKSLKLISASLILSLVFGILRGLYEGYSSKMKQFRSLGSLIIFSIPDVLIVLIGLMIMTYISNNLPMLKQSLPINEFILPLIVLSIIPSIYVSRITYITIHDEFNKEYIKNAKAVGYSKFAIYTREMMPAIIFKIIDSIPTILTMLFSNMIIVEYLFNYNGIVYYLLYLYNRHDVYRFVPLALSLGAIYLVITWVTSLIIKWVNPLKQEVDK